MHSLAPALAPVPLTLPLRLEASDSEAVSQILHGNREMFEVIVRRYNGQLYRVGMAYLRDHTQTEDAMQNAYLKAFLHLNRFRGTASFATWLTRIMVNECLMFLRRQKNIFMESLDDRNAPVDHESFVAPATEPVLNQEEVKAVLEQAIKTLPRAHRAVYLLREVQHLSTAETAQCLGMSPENVKVSLHRAREELKAQLMKNAAAVELFDYPAQYCDPMTAKVMENVRNLAMPTSGHEAAPRQPT